MLSVSNLTEVSLTAGGPEERQAIPVVRVPGSDMRVEGLVLPDHVLQLVEHERALAMLAELGRLPLNWDGYGALPIDRQTIGNSKGALLLLLRYTPAPDITPNPNGTIGFEWNSDQGEAHLEIGKTRFSFFARANGGRPILAEGLVPGITNGLASLIAAVVFPSAGSSTAITKTTYTAGHEQTVG
jgi:hypothetical protein